MAVFQYTIKDVKGLRVEGTLKATSMDEAVDKLTKEGSIIISVKPGKEGAFSGQLSMLDKIMLTIYKIRTGISLKILVFFTRQLATMFSAGLTIEKSLTNLAREEKTSVLKKFCSDYLMILKKDIVYQNRWNYTLVYLIHYLLLWLKQERFLVHYTPYSMNLLHI